MTLTTQDLDGTYRVTTVTDYTGPVPMQSDGETEIVNGETHRVDKKGCKWRTRFTVLSETEVQMDSTADPSEAEADFCLTTASGELTRDPVTYTTVLNVARKGDKIRLSGQIDHGNIATVITMIK
ncbi:MAG: hypothetical protein OXT65_09170, partial [Alphaproteobacteria bacterium]|nr:hypothetical protein [Alphaproteobacteria bacterium]